MPFVIRTQLRKLLTLRLRLKYTLYPMLDPVIPAKIPVEVPYGVVDTRAVFRKPILKTWLGTALIIAGVLEALEPFGFKLEGVDLKTQTEKLNDYAVVFKRNVPGTNLTMTLQLGRLVWVAENLDWTEAHQFIQTAQAGLMLLSRRQGQRSSFNMLVWPCISNLRRSREKRLWLLC